MHPLPQRYSEDEETLATEDVTYTGAELAEAVDVYAADGGEAPIRRLRYLGTGIPALLESVRCDGCCRNWLKGLILDGIVAGVGAVLGFVPRCWYCSSSWHSWSPVARTWTVSSVSSLSINPFILC